MRPQIELTFPAVLLLAVSNLEAQGRDVDFLYGRWYSGNQTTAYELRTATPLGAHLGHGLAGYALVHDSLGRQRAFYGAGWEVQALRHRRRLGPYALAGVALGLSTDTASQELAALWNLGGGVEWRPITWFAVGVEGQYRLQDVGPRGFWRAASDSRDGWSGAIAVSVGLGKREWRGGADKTSAPHAARPALSAPAVITGSAADVVRTALDALGSPYEWGGSAENGFDCSGLIQYAYARHGFRLPRTSREQSNSGSLVTPVLDALKPGDILLFAAQPGGGVTHVGMYVGEQTFIHSANSGVKLSRLEAQDPDGAWWVARWVGARRIVE